MPAFHEVLAAAAGGRLVIEIKNVRGEPDYSPDALQARLVVAALEDLIGPAHQTERDVLISSFDPRVCDVARDAGWPVGLLAPPWADLQREAAYAIEAGYQELHAHVSAFTRKRVRRALADHLSDDIAGSAAVPLRVAAWTITTASQALALRDAGVDAVICDDPAGVVAALAADAARKGGQRWRALSMPGLKAGVTSRLWQLERARRRRAARRARR